MQVVLAASFPQVFEPFVEGIHFVHIVLPAKHFKWLLKVIKVQRAGKGHIVLLEQTTY